MAAWRTRRRSIGIIASLLVLVGIVSTAGRVGSHTPSAATILLRAYTTTEDQRTARFTVIESTSADIDGFQQPLVTHGEGSEDLMGDSGQVSLTIDGKASMEERAVSGKLYLGLPPSLLAGLLGQKRWTELPVSAFGSRSSGQGEAPLLQPGPVLAQTLSYLKAAPAQDLVAAAAATIGGVATTEYQATDIDCSTGVSGSPAETSSGFVIGTTTGTGRSIDPTLSIDTALPPDTTRPASASLPTATTISTATGPSIVSVWVWVDAEHRIRQLRTVVVSGSPKTTVSTTVDYSDFGVPVVVVAPPRSEVKDFASNVAVAA